MERAIREIPSRYPGVTVDCCAMMPDHVHLVLAIQQPGPDGLLVAAPTSLSTIVQQFKRAVSRTIGVSIWQKSYYDHVIRSDADPAEARQYIQSNPAKALEERV